MTKQEKERQEAREDLLKHLQPGDTVYTVLRHVSRSGMMRVIDPFIMHEGRPFYLRGYVRRLGLGTVDRAHDGVRVQGCGMDMGFHLVYSLSWALWPHGFECSGENCQSNDHSNGDRDRTPHVHKDGGYALKQEWV